MKKVLAFTLMIVMMFAMSANVYAETITNDGTVSGDKNQNVTITYTSNISYTVTIPDAMSIGQDATISVSNVMIDVDQGLSITVSSTQYSNGWLLKDQNTKKTVGYTLKNAIPGADLPNNGTVLYTTSGVDAEATLYTDIKRAPLYTGTFTDTLTFSIKIADRNVSKEEAEALIAQCRELPRNVTSEEQSKFTTELSILSTKWNILNEKVQSVLVNKDGQYTQAELNDTYFSTLEYYESLFYQLEYSKG